MKNIPILAALSAVILTGCGNISPPFKAEQDNGHNSRTDSKCGGEANCAVVVSDEPIGSPLVSEPPVLVAMNKPSLIKFMPMMPAGGTLLYNASLIEGVELRTDVTVIPVACNEVAEQLGNGRVSNMVMLGAIQAATEVVTDDNLVQTLRDWLGEKKAHLLDINLKAIEAGRAIG